MDGYFDVFPIDNRVKSRMCAVTLGLKRL
jgi:hypothetical protein